MYLRKIRTNYLIFYPSIQPKFEANGGSNRADKETIKSRIAKLNTTDHWKNIVIQLLLIDFKGQLLHPSNKSEIGYSQSNAAQVNKINASGENQGSCIGSCSGGAQYLPHADCSKFCQCSNGRPILMPCSPTLHWDTKLNTCDAPDVAQCQR
uniref:Chitin-binding type-2 domain-containing protein n=1 Tax=Trichogramma kaykai TaxID=54128 RepID=A0ABD2XC77_9HYME